MSAKTRVAAERASRLAALGIHLADDALEPGVRAECTRLARHLLVGRARVIGLLPTTIDVAIPPVAIQLGRAVCELSGGTCAVVDANVRWPALSRAIDEEPQRGGDDSTFATRWLHDQLALLAPRQAGDAGAGLVELARLIREGRELFPVILADLTGFDLLGEHLAAMALVEGVVLVAQAGKVREARLLGLSAELPPDKRLGVLLVGDGAPDAPPRPRKGRRLAQGSAS